MRFDARGNGLSDREMPGVDFDLMVEDLRAVFDAAGVARAPILAISQGCAVSAAFAAQYPERVRFDAGRTCSFQRIVLSSCCYASLAIEENPE